MKILLVYPPFCTPVSPPYSITNLSAFLKKNGVENEVLDLNQKYHSIRFPKYKTYFQNFNKDFKKAEYDRIYNEFKVESEEDYRINNKQVIQDKNISHFKEIFEEILSKKPDIVGFSVVFSSQSFYTYALIKELKKLKIKTIVGGPAVSRALEKSSTKKLNNEVELLEFITENKNHVINNDTPLDYSQYDLTEYFTPQSVLPIKTSHSCFYRKCTFCTHHKDETYSEISLDLIEKTIKSSKSKYFFVIDDQIHKERLLKLAEIFKKEKAVWMCQLKPTKELDFNTLNILFESGLKIIIWGVESGSQRILDLMKKGTNVTDITNVLENSRKAGIKNTLFIMFGFPTESLEEFNETISFLKKNIKNIDLVLTSIFGLQKGSPIFNNYNEYKIKKIIKTKRTILDEKIEFEMEPNITILDVNKLRKSHKPDFEKINKFPKGMNYFREHMLILV